MSDKEICSTVFRQNMDQNNHGPFGILFFVDQFFWYIGIFLNLSTTLTESLARRPLVWEESSEWVL